jgi:tungstate transport system substrate-binding protein
MYRMRACWSFVRGALYLLVTMTALAVAACGSAGDGRRPVILAATTSTQDSGLLDVLVPAFESDSGWDVRTLVLGSGQAIVLGRRGEADVLLAHSPAAERELMASGVARARRLVMVNDFVVVGPRADPAGAAGRPPAEALAAIARRRAPFVSRGDESGTHAFELELWKRAPVRPRAPWYQETGQGQSATLSVAAERGGYALSDRATYLATRADEDLRVITGGGAAMANPYHVIDLTARAGERVNAAGARALADWLVGPRAQALIGAFGRRDHGRALFEPAADVGAH